MSDPKDSTRTRAAAEEPAEAQSSHPDRPSSPPGGGAPRRSLPTDALGPPAAIREALLWRLENRAVAELLRQFGDLLFEIVDETGQFGPDPGAAELVRPALRAAAGDLFHVARDLSEVALMARASSLVPEEKGLAKRAEVWSAQATALGAAIRRGVGEG